MPALLIVAVTIVLGVFFAFAIIRALRRHSYRRWPALGRWAFFAVVAALASLGAAGMVYNTAQKWDVPAAVWLLLAPLAWGLWRRSARRTRG